MQLCTIHQTEETSPPPPPAPLSQPFCPDNPVAPCLMDFPASARSAHLSLVLIGFYDRIYAMAFIKLKIMSFYEKCLNRCISFAPISLSLSVSPFWCVGSSMNLRRRLRLGLI